MGRNFLTNIYLKIIYKLTKNALVKKLPLIIEVIDDEHDSSSFDLIHAMFLRCFDSVGVAPTVSTDIKLLHDLWRFPQLKPIFTQQLPALFLINGNSAKDYDKSLIKPDFAIVLSITEKAYLDRLTSSLGTPKKIILSQEIIEKYPDLATKKYSLLDQSMVTTTVKHTQKGTDLIVEGTALMQTAQIHFPKVLVNENIGAATEAVLLLLSIISLPLDNALLSLENTFANRQNAFGVKKGKSNTTLLDASNTNGIQVSPMLLEFQHNIAKKDKRLKLIVLGNNMQLTRTILKKMDILVLAGEKQRKTGIKQATTADFVLNENLYWFSDGTQLSFHIAELIEDNAVVLFAGNTEDHLELAVSELTK
jgi:hypothetical protein